VVTCLHPLLLCFASFAPLREKNRFHAKLAKYAKLNSFSAPLRLCGVFLFFVFVAGAQVPSPQSVLGFHPTDDKTIADWKQIVDYFTKLDKASDRVLVKEIGRTTQDRPMIVAFISSSANIKNLEKYRQISARLADPRTVKDATEAQQLVQNGKTIISISCSIHSTEIVASQMSMNLAYELATANDADTKEILDNTILLLIPSPNPDGVQIVADWYRKTLGSKAEGTSPPELYHFYAGHDDNRDWFMMNLKETQAITKLFWQQWFPQIVYDVHQQGENASRFIIPPFYDPTNPRVDPAILRDVGLIGYKMAADLQEHNIAGVATNSTYDTWWHGGFRTVPYFHNSIGILSEAASARLMTPATVTRDELARNRSIRGLSDLLTPATNYPDPWTGGEWHPRDITNIEMIASRALLELAAKFRPRYLQNFYNLGRQNLSPKPSEPVAYIVTAGQPNAEAVSRMLEILMWQGIEIHRLTNELLVKTDSKQTDFHEMPLGSYLIFVNQPQKNNILALFERQVYPKRLLPNGDAEAPYDVAGWTLPLQMGVDYAAVWQIQNLVKDRPSLKRVDSINQIRSDLGLDSETQPFASEKYPLHSRPRIAIYKGYTASMDEGWTRFVFDTFQIPYTSLTDKQLRSGDLPFDVIVLPSMAENAITRGLTSENYPDEYRGGIGETGVDNIKKFVDRGGKLICWDASCEMVIKQFNLPIKSVLVGIRRNEFYNPGSIVQLMVNRNDPLAHGLAEDTAAYFINSAAYDVTEGSRVRTVARYADHDVLLSGWMLGEKYLTGKTALAEADYGKGKIDLFAFRPQHRGQTWGTFRFIFNALEK
jgi:Zinc carboxypeptidase